MTDQPKLARDSAAVPAAALVIEANFDDITKAAFRYRREQVYPYLESKGIEITLLQDGMARREYVATAASQPGIGYLLGVGHGQEDCFCGYENSSIFRIGEYEEEEVRGKIVHLLSCSTAITLGADFIARGALAFFGYRDDFAIPFEDLEELDDLVEDFLGSDAEIERALADGLALNKILERVTQKFNDQIGNLKQRGKREASAALQTNRDRLIGLLK